MAVFTEGSLVFTFPETAEVGRLDAWAFYRNQFLRIPGSKAVDFVCLLGDECWLIEVKDYRLHRRAKASDIWDEVACKARDTLACLAAAQHNATVGEEKPLAHRALRAPRWRVVLHLEQRPPQSRLHRGSSFGANLKMKLKRVLKGIDPHPLVDSLSAQRGPWQVTSGPTGRGH